MILVRFFFLFGLSGLVASASIIRRLRTFAAAAAPPTATGDPTATSAIYSTATAAQLFGTIASFLDRPTE